MKKLITSLLLSVPFFLVAQNEFCHTDKVWAELVRNDSSLYYKRLFADEAASRANEHVSSFPQHAQGRSSANLTPVVIPTVIYVVHDGTPASNISMQQIQSQMDQLNANFDSMGVQFCYAKKNVADSSLFTPQAGDSAGVFRINSPLTNFDRQTQETQLKALSTLSAQNYLRIFVVKTLTPAGLLGYAYFPGSMSTLDGIVIRADVFGSTNFCPPCNLNAQHSLGAVLTHEAGHYLNLYHTFQGGCITSGSPTWISCQNDGDRVCDTPPTEGSFGCPSTAPLSCNGTDYELIENYMDYTDDQCKNSFTPGQKARIDYGLNAYRSVLISTSNLIKTGMGCVAFGNRYAEFYCANYNGCLNRAMTFKSLATPGFTYSWNLGDGYTATGSTVIHYYQSKGQFVVTLTASNTSQGINAFESTPVFITDCAPINCSTNKWNSEYGFLDFSSGTPVAVTHPKLNPYSWNFPEFFDDYYRADTAGNALFHIGVRAYADVSATASGLIDSSYNLVDSIGNGDSWTLVPVPGRVNTFCLIGSSSSDSISYSIIPAGNGNVGTLPGKKLLRVPFPPGTVLTATYRTHTAGIPSCDGTKFWLVLMHECSRIIYVFKLDSTMTLTHHQTYNLGSNRACWGWFVSPDGRKLITHETNTSDDWLLMNFNKSTGFLTSHSIFYTGTTGFSAGNGCFSPTSRFFYQAEWDKNSFVNSNTTGVLYQYDMNNPNPVATRKTVLQYSKKVSNGAHCYTAPDKKIYVGFVTYPFNAPEAYRLAVINEPDVLDNGLNAIGFNMNGPDIKPPNNPNSGINAWGFGGRQDLYDAFDCGWKPGKPSTFGYYTTPSSCRAYQFHSDDCFSHDWNFGDAASGASNTSTLTSPAHVFSAPGTYLVISVINGTTFTDSVIVEEQTVQIAASRLQNCPTPSGNYSIASPNPDVTYTWTITNGTPTSVASATDVDVQWNDTTGMIKVVAVNRVTGCVDTALLPFSISSCYVSGIENEESVETITVIPNPSKDYFTVTGKSKFNGRLEMKILNSLGHVMEEITFNLVNEPLHVLIDATLFADGVYLIALKTENRVLMKRIVKE